VAELARRHDALAEVVEVFDAPPGGEVAALLSYPQLVRVPYQWASCTARRGGSVTGLV
jgi:hypothetical protein